MLIDWFTVGAQAVNFLILVWLMKRFLYRPVLAAIDAREKKIAGELQRAAAAKQQAEKEREDLRTQTEALQGQREQLLRAATADADVQRQHLLENARQESQALRSKLIAALTSEQAELKLEVVSRTRREAFALTRKTLTDLADTRLEDQMLEVFVRRVAGLNEAQRAQIIPPPRSAHSREAVLRSAFELTPAQQVSMAASFKHWPCEGATLRFETSPGLISGLELIVDGQKIAWNVTAYLAAVEERVEGLLTTAESAPIPVTDVQHATA
ncbi:MAG: F-type H+-transporting ATPase subunit b [Gammaproteobacteria bacterium]|nr:F-type H+-transporting ATPase subunit b [Gammaproteobacteria bacterium]